MANLREVRTRIASVKSTRQITSAMKMVSASKLRKAQNAIDSLRYYSNNLKDLLIDLGKAASIAQDHKYTLQNKDGEKALIVICSSNKGLCGPFNTHIIKRATTHINSLKELNYDISLFIIGKRANDFFKKREDEIVEFDSDIIDNISFENTRIISDKLKDYFSEKDYVRIDVVYNSFKNPVVQESVSETLLPVRISDQTEAKKEENIRYSESDDLADLDHIKHILEPSAKSILDFVIPEVIDVEVYRILLDAFASEHGARMTAMHQSTENANEIIKELTTTYNKVRQASITKELVEIVSSAEALK